MTTTEKENKYRGLNFKSIKSAVKNGTSTAFLMMYEIEDAISFMDRYNRGYDTSRQKEAQKETDRLIRLHKKLTVTFWDENGNEK